jgi:hypothetical protein
MELVANALRHAEIAETGKAILVVIRNWLVFCFHALSGILELSGVAIRMCFASLQFYKGVQNCIGHINRPSAHPAGGR